MYKWLTNIEIEEIKKQWERNNSTVKIQEDNLEIIKHNENKQHQQKEQSAQEVLVEQGHESEQHSALVHFQKMMKY